MNRVDDFLDAVGKAFAGMDLSTFEPIDCFDIFPLYAKEGINRLLKIIESTDNNPKWNNNRIELARKMHSPSVIRVEMILALIKARLASVKRKKLVRIAEFYNSLLESWCLDDPYAKDGKNIIHTRDEIKQFINNLKPADPKTAKELGKLVNACYHLAYGLYSDINPQICYENFGPYNVSDEFGQGHILIIKQFQNLRPVKLWKDKIEDLAYKRIRIYCVYKDVRFSIDAASHSNYEGNLIDGLKFFGVDIDGRMVDDLSEVKQAAKKIGLKTIEIWESLTSLDFEKAKIKYLEQRCYNYIIICKQLGLDWRPTKEMLNAVKNMSLAKDFWHKFDDPEDEGKFWRMMCDPRIGTEQLRKYWK